ncbi:hypothetical protein [Streptomyces sp. NPDC093097]|uniref:hypothetical protein n=1 Tax=Streptomyces sp. NPDC093097 TaxID=3366027 RepID=UPI0037FEDCF5
MSTVGTIVTWFSLFVCQLRLRRLSDAGVIPASPFRMPFHPYGSYVGPAFLALVVLGVVIQGWKSSPDFWGKTDFIAVVIRVPIVALIMQFGWSRVRRGVEEHTGGQLGPKWPIIDRNGRVHSHSTKAADREPAGDRK